MLLITVDNREKDNSGENKTIKKVDTILKTNGNTTKTINVKSHGNKINLHPLIIKLLNTEKTVLRKDDGFDE